MLIIISISFAAYGIHKFLMENEKYVEFINSKPIWINKPLGKCLYCFSFWFISIPATIIASLLLAKPYYVAVFIPPFLTALIYKIIELISMQNELVKQKQQTESILQNAYLLNNEIIKNKLENEQN